MAQNPRNLCPNPYAASATTGAIAGNGTLSRPNNLASPWVKTTGYRVTKNATAGDVSITLTPTADQGASFVGQAWSGVVQWSASAPGSGIFYVILVSMNSAGDTMIEYVSQVNPTVTANAVVTTYLRGTTTNTNGRRYSIFLYSTGAPANSTITATAARIDDVDNSALPYADGNTAGWFWTGATGTTASYQPLAISASDSASTNESRSGSTSFPATVPDPSQAFTRWDYRTSGTQLTQGTNTPADSGGAYFNVSTSPITPLPYSQVNNGRLEPVWTGTLTSTQSQALYHHQQVAQPGTRFSTIGAWITAPSNATSFAFNMAMVDQHPGFNTNTMSVPCHMNYYPGGWDFSVVQPGFVYTTLAQGTYSPAVSWDNTTFRQVQVSISGNTATILLPNGVTTTVTDSRIGSLPGHAAWWEFGRFNGASATATAMGVRNMYAFPAATTANPLGKDLAIFSEAMLLDTAGGNKLGMDTGTLSETRSVASSHVRTDLATLSEAAAVFASHNRSDTATGADQQVSSAQPTTSDSATLFEQQMMFQGLLKEVSDLAGFSEAVSIFATHNRSDTASQTDNRTGSQPYSTQNRTDTSNLTEIEVHGPLGSDIASFYEVVQPRFNYIYTSETWVWTETRTGNFQYQQFDLFEFLETGYVNVIDVRTDDPFDYPDYILPQGEVQRDLRVIAQDHFTREIIHWDLPLDTVVLTFNLSGPNLLSGSLTSEMLAITTLNPGLTPDRTWLHVEENNQIVASFILTNIIDSPETQSRQIEAEGFSAYPHWIIYEGSSYVGVQVDPSLIIEKLWRHVQSFPDGNLGVQVLNTGTPVRIGYPPNTTNLQTTTGINVDLNNGGPYLLNFWTAINCGEEINKLCQESPIEFYEWSYWNQYKTDIEHRIVLGYPRVGKKRTDLKFREGENLYQLIPSYTETNENYASDVLVIGAGTGPDSIRAKASGRIGRLRKTKVLQDQNISRTIQAQQIAKFEFTRLNESRFLIESITVDLTHPNAQFGEFAPGDDIYIQCEVPYVGFVQRWYRIVSMQYDIYNKTASLTVDPSESFSYGATKVDPTSYMPTKGFAIVSSWPIWKGDIPAGGEVVGSANVVDDRLEALKGDAVGRACQKFDVYGIPPGKAYVYSVQNNIVYDHTVNIQDTGDGNYTLIIAKTEEGGIFVGDNVFFIDSLGNYMGQRPDKTEQLETPLVLPAVKAWANKIIQVWQQDPKQIDEGLRFAGYENVPGSDPGLYANYLYAKIYYGWGGTYSSDGPGPELFGIMTAVAAGNIWIY